VYDSYVTDPQYADYFTYGWTSALALAFLIAAPSIVAYGTSGRWREGGLVGKLGVYEDTKGGGYSSLSPADDRRVVDPPAKAVPRPARKVLLYVQALVASVTLRTLAVPRWMDPSRLPFLSRLSSSSASCHPSNPRLPFSIGSLVTVGGLVALVLCTLLPESQLAENPNRFGFLALASLPPLFLLSAKSGPVMWLTGKGWTGVNFLHRWMGRIVVLLVLLHFYFWTVQVSCLIQDS
jgi:ferric-chelate reductase